MCHTFCISVLIPKPFQGRKNSSNVFLGKYLYMPSEQQFDELPYAKLLQSQTFVFVIGWFFKSVNTYVMIRFFQLNGFLRCLLFKCIIKHEISGL